MKLRVRKLVIRIRTDVGVFGTDVVFGPGLNVLSAPNSSGKSTCMTGILYALGLEGMLGPSQQPPFPESMLTRIRQHDGTEVEVRDSIVRLEIENEAGEAIAVQRKVAGTPLERQLIRCRRGPALTQQGEFPQTDYYVRTAGGAQSEAGFHRFLAEFLGYQLPLMPTTDGGTVPLYLECLFPAFFVDQLSGWRDLKARMPTYLRIPEMVKRSLEYILDLDIFKNAIAKETLENRLRQLKVEWSTKLTELKAELSGFHVVSRGMPTEPVSEWPPAARPQLLLTNGDNWIALDEALQGLRQRHDELLQEEIPRAEQVSQETVQQLQFSEAHLEKLTGQLRRASRELIVERSQLESIYERLGALVEDHRQYQDAQKIVDRGGAHGLKTATGHCPTCNQELKDTLSDQAASARPMPLEQNIAFIKDQIATFHNMYEDTKDVTSAKQKEVDAISDQITSATARIRSLKRTLNADGRLPSIEAIQESVQLDNRITVLETAAQRYTQTLQPFEQLAAEWKDANERLERIGSATLSERDEQKLRYFERVFKEQLTAYRFESLPVEEISIGRQTYRPARRGYDIGLISASDTIRVVWAYLLGLLELDRHFKTNHAGVVLFDEPRQQGAAAFSFDSLLSRASTAKSTQQQVIFATSEDFLLLGAMLQNLDCTLIQYDGRILRKLEG